MTTNNKLWTLRKLRSRQYDAMRWNDFTNLEAEQILARIDQTEPETLIMPRGKWAPVLKVLRFGEKNADAWAKLPKLYLEALEEIARTKQRVAELEEDHWAGQPELVSDQVIDRAARTYYEELRRVRNDPINPPWDDAWYLKSEYRHAMQVALEELMGQTTDEKEEQ